MHRSTSWPFPLAEEVASGSARHHDPGERHPAIANLFPAINDSIFKVVVRRVIAEEWRLAVIERASDSSNPQEEVCG
jgi:hypothetical protein